MKPIDYSLVKTLYAKYIYRDKQGIKSKWKDIVADYEKETGELRSENSLRHATKSIDKETMFNESRGNLPIRPIKEYGVDKSENEGLYYSDRYIEVNVNSKLDENDVLLAHGFDPAKWEIVNAGSTGSRIGTSANEEQYFINTYRKLTVRPKQFKLTEDILNELVMSSNVKPVVVDKIITRESGLLEIPLFDMHFGMNTFEDYKQHQLEIINYIESQGWEENIYIIGQDLFHNDNFRGQTSSGTIIDKVDMQKAWSDCLQFYSVLLETSLEQAKEVKIIFSRGNHDESLGWAFVKMLEVKYPQIEVDDIHEETKIHIYQNVFLGYTHGDKINDKKLAQSFNALYRLEMAKATTRIIKRGHMHTNKMIDEFGTLVMGLGTAAKTDEWHESNGFVGNRKAFEIFIYDHEKLKGHMYIG